jgi:hypothetical protein
VTSRNSFQRRRTWFEELLSNAATPKRRLQVVCQWLIAESWALERVTEAEQAVLGEVRRIRGEEAGP